MKKGINLKERNGQWKGDKVKYNALHDYIKYHFPKTKFCQCCGLVPPFDCANISGEYKRDLSDWEWLCRKCHMIKDGRIELIKKSVDKRRWDRNMICELCNEKFFACHHKQRFCSYSCASRSKYVYKK